MSDSGLPLLVIAFPILGIVFLLAGVIRVLSEIRDELGKRNL